MSSLMRTAAVREENRRSLKAAAIWILIILVTALSWPDHTAGAGSADLAVTVRVLHTATGDGEITPCG